MLATKLKPKIDPADAEFESAKTAWTEAQTKHRELHDRLEAMELARSLASAPGAKPAMPDHLRKRAKPFLKLATRNREKLVRDIADLKYACEDFQPIYVAAHEAWEFAQNELTNRIAIGLQDVHQAAVKQIAEALESLSRAIAAEREVHAELGRLAPKSMSGYLPNMSNELWDFAVSEWGSKAWRWAKRARELKILG